MITRIGTSIIDINQLEDEFFADHQHPFIEAEAVRGHFLGEAFPVNLPPVFQRTVAFAFAICMLGRYVTESADANTGGSDHADRLTARLQNDAQRANQWRGSLFDLIDTMC